MFTKSNSASKLDRAIVASIAAMLAFNAVVLVSQLETSPRFALAQGELVKQA